MTDAPLPRLLTALRFVTTSLAELDRRFALVGGLAVSVRSEPRFTRDIDIAVDVNDDADAEHLVADLAARGFKLQLSLEQEAIGRLATVRLSPPAEPVDGVAVDLLFASSGIEHEICQAADLIEIVKGLQVPVASTGHLVAMKLLSRRADRPQDDVDLRGLLGVARADDLQRARTAVDRIEQLGANRGRTIRQDLELLLQKQ